MNSKKITNISLALVCWLSLFAYPLMAENNNCQCKKEELKEAADNATSIFTGHVRSIKNDPLRTKYKRIEFKVSKKIKGLDHNDTNFVVIYSEKDDNSCKFKFIQNGSYLVYATGSPARLKVSSCSRTGLLEPLLSEATEVDDYLNYDIEIEEVVEEVKTTTTTKYRVTRPSQLGF